MKLSFCCVGGQNAFGWLAVGLVCCSWLYYALELRERSEPSAGSALFMATPPFVSLVCTSVFYLVYPPHQSGVRWAAVCYLAFVAALFAVIKRKFLYATKGKLG